MFHNSRVFVVLVFFYLICHSRCVLSNSYLEIWMRFSKFQNYDCAYKNIPFLPLRMYTGFIQVTKTARYKMNAGYERVYSAKYLRAYSLSDIVVYILRVHM